MIRLRSILEDARILEQCSLDAFHPTFVGCGFVDQVFGKYHEVYSLPSRYCGKVP